MIPGMRHPDNMTRKEKLAVISAMKQNGQHADATRWWLTHMPRLSRSAYEEL